MEILILKSAACLAILMVFYKLFLENLAIHKFKRFYLLGTLVVSIVIPFITFIEYIEPHLEVPLFNADQSIPLDLLPFSEVAAVEPLYYLPVVLWSIYGLGVLLFTTKFCINLFNIVSKINKNEKQKHNNFISVLLNDLIIPHTFFSYIFLNKTKFEAKAIPQEVLLHEQTHASQKHSLDILFIELLQIVLWFNPLLYFIKKDIKLNHEFLADEAVLKQGIDSSTYQETLLQFTSNANEMPLAHAINYSLIKKRFTIMKTQTSRKAVWLRSLLLVPLLGGLLFSFSGREQIEKDVVSAIVFPSEEKSNNTNPILELKQDPLHLVLNGEQTTLETLKNDFIKATDGNKSDLKIEAKGLVDYDLIKEIMSVISKDYLLKIHLSEEVYIQDNTGYENEKSQKEATPEQVAEYNKLAKYYNAEIKDNAIIKLKDFNRIKELYNLMSDAQKKNAEPFPNFPPPPPPPIKAPQYENNKKLTLNQIIEKTPIGVESGYEMLKNGESHYYTVHQDKRTYYNKDGYITDENGKILPPPPPVPPKVKKGEASLIPPPPPPAPPKSTEEHAKEMAKINANFYYNGNAISSEKAIELLENNSKMNISTLNNNGKRTVNLSDKPITLVNGKAVSNQHQTGSMDINGEKHFYSTKNGVTTIYNKDGTKVDANGKSKSISITKTKVKNDTINYKTVETVKLIKGDSNGYVIINNTTCYYIKQANTIEYYNRWGVLIDENGEELNNTIDDRKSMIENRKKMLEERKNKRRESLEDRKALLEERKEEMLNKRNQTRRPLAEQFKGMEANGTTFFYEGDKISEAKAIELTKENPKLNLSMQNNNGVSTVHLSKKGITTVNGKLVKKEE
ncbi:M56 family metallopeptidase [Lacinutrix sp. Bg11-31]|uniref:M56 family metallopeptidase n=1 Tax=Lacinutrix sp. Bg11-31 TaxID=2057808 RepID=UPI000C314555|nr:M56 family metallopeptidase [Lacinutrix sp. Bg11-31]AUC82532.1 hypothetical protein CW733_10505 [Lacinutrix sp. Bg11-31]